MKVESKEWSNKVFIFGLTTQLVFNWQKLSRQQSPMKLLTIIENYMKLQWLCPSVPPIAWQVSILPKKNLVAVWNTAPLPISLGATRATLKHFVCMICKAIIKRPTEGLMKWKWRIAIVPSLTWWQTKDLREHAAGVFNLTALTETTLTWKGSSGWIRVDLCQTPSVEKPLCPDFCKRRNWSFLESQL